MSGAFEGWAKKSNSSEFHNERVFSVRRAFPYDRTITLSHLWTFILKLFQWDSKLFAQPIPSTTFIESIHFTSIHIDDSVNTHTDNENRSLGGFALSHEKWKKNLTLTMLKLHEYRVRVTQYHFEDIHAFFPRTVICIDPCHAVQWLWLRCTSCCLCLA